MILQSHMEEGERALARVWKTTALRGIVAIGFALVILIWPNVGLTALISLFGAFALVSGIATIVGAFGVSMRDGRRAWLVLEGLLGVAVAVVVFLWPDLSALGLLYAIATWAIALGIVEIAVAFVLAGGGTQSLLAVLGGLFSIAFGVIMFAHPGAGAVALLALIAAFALVTGAMQVSSALDVRRVAGKLERRPRAHATARPVTHG